MKRFMSFALALVFLFAFVGCAKEEPLDGGGTLATTEETTENAPAYPLMSGDNIHTIAFVSDTQKFSEKTFNAVYESFLNDKDTYNIEYVIHTGDVIQESDDLDADWQIAKNAMSKLDGVIPYAVIAGNHDQETNTDTPFGLYSSYFGDSSYEGCDYFAGSYSDCRALAQLITIGSTDFIFVYISDGPDKGCIDFANEMFEKYSDRVGVLCTHRYFEDDMDFDDMGEYLLKKVVKPNENVKLVLCGHASNAGYVETKISDDRTVIQIMADYQDAYNDGSLMYLQIDEDNGTLTGISYSPVTKSYEGYKDIDTDQFQVKLPW